MEQVNLILLILYILYTQLLCNSHTIKPHDKYNKNNTGKSTILCAICLGLGGQPPLLGRADDARLFIKHEKESASIEIELAPKVNSNSGKYEATHIIRRVIERNRGSEKGKGAGASLYYINGHKCNLKSVKELVSDRYVFCICVLLLVGFVGRGCVVYCLDGVGWIYLVWGVFG